jgi:hypothetical protein
LAGDAIDSGDQFIRGEITIDAEYSPKDFVRRIVKHGPNNEYVCIEHNTVGKIDLLRTWLTGLPSNVVNPTLKRAAGVSW